MTPEELEQAILRGDRQRCLELLSGATEATRRAAAPVALRWFRACHDLRMRELTSDAQALARFGGDSDAILAAAGTATLATATLSELKALRWRAHFFDDTAWEALVERGVDWLDGWAKWVLAESPGNWLKVRRLVREGLIPVPQEDAYITGLIAQQWPRKPLELLRSDPGLLEHEVWRLFEVEGGGEDSLAARDKYSGGQWAHALRTLAEEGLLDRGRLLDASLAALQRDFAQFRAGWFSAFHESLAPSVEERAAREEQYLALLGSRIPPTVSFALKALAVLDKAGRLSGEALVGHAAPALAAREKGTVTLALKLLDRAAKREVTLAAPVAAVACEALLHEKPEVQGAALDLIERHGNARDATLAGLVRERLGDLSPTQRPRAEAWLGAATPPAAPSVAAWDDAALIARAGALSPWWREAAGVDAALALLRDGGPDIAPLTLPFGAFPVLDPNARLSPVETLDELIDVTAGVLENLGPPEEIERMLDGISRLCGERPEDFARRTAPISKRAKALSRRVEHCGAWLGFIPRDFPELVLAWTTGTVAPRGKSSVDLTSFSGQRIVEVACRAAAAKAAPLLALPTHRGGWIDPRELVRRARELQLLGIEAGLYDAVQALLRLAPDHRAEALAAATELRGELGEAIRYALGGTGIGIGPTAALWVAATRGRAPREEDAALEARHPGLGPDAALPARAALRVKRKLSKYLGKEHVYYEKTVDVEPPPPRKPVAHFPTVLFHTKLGTEPNAITTRQWLATIWPGGREAWFEEGVRVIANNLEWWEAEWQNRVHLEALLEPDTPLGAMGRMLLGLGLGAREAAEAGLATDAAIAALQDGRLTGAALGETLSDLLTLGVETGTPLQREQRERDPKAAPHKPGGMITGTRWARTLGEVARASTLHAEAVRVALVRVLAGRPSLRPADAAALLELLHELSAQLAADVGDPEARRFLESLGGGGKGGKLAKALLALAPGDRTPHLREAARLALEGRVARAERWAAWSDGCP